MIQEEKPVVASARTSGYPLFVLFFVLAAAAILLALVAPVITAVGNQKTSYDDCVSYSVRVGILGLILGIFIGLYHYQRFRGVGWGALTGSVIGACVGPVMLSTDYDQVLGTCLGGSLLLILLGGLCRFIERAD